MALQRGPLKIQDPAVLNLTAGVYDFSDYTITELGDIDGLLAEIDYYLPDVIAAGAEPEDPITDVDLDGLILSLADDPTVSMYSDVAGMETQLGVSDNQFIVAVALAPGDSWSPPAPLFVPPDTTGDGGAPAPPPVRTIGPEEAAGAYLMAPPPGYSFTFVNLTAYGSSSFTVGDQFSIAITGPAGASVSADAWQSSNPMGTTPFGNLDGNGNWSLSGTMPPEVVGNWFERWYVDSTLVMELEFNVVPPRRVKWFNKSK